MPYPSVADTHGSEASDRNPETATAKLFRLMLESKALKFGTFKLKSGRMSPYFANFGLICTGGALAKLGKLYAGRIIDFAFPKPSSSAVHDTTFGFGGFVNTDLPFDVLFGPAYKGITLAASAAIALSELLGKEIPYAYNRKEAKDHGEGGNIVGAGINGKRVWIVDDVITSGKAIGESVDAIVAAGGIPVGAIVGLDRMEVAEEGGTKSAVQEAAEKYGFPVISIANLDDLFAYVREAADTGNQLAISADGSGPNVETVAKEIDAYREKYGADYGVAAAAPS